MVAWDTTNCYLVISDWSRLLGYATPNTSRTEGCSSVHHVPTDSDYAKLGPISLTFPHESLDDVAVVLVLVEAVPEVTKDEELPEEEVADEDVTLDEEDEDWDSSSFSSPNSHPRSFRFLLCTISTSKILRHLSMINFRSFPLKSRGIDAVLEGFIICCKA